VLCGAVRGDGDHAEQEEGVARSSSWIHLISTVIIASLPPPFSPTRALALLLPPARRSLYHLDLRCQCTPSHMAALSVRLALWHIGAGPNALQTAIVLTLVAAAAAQATCSAKVAAAIQTVSGDGSSVACCSLSSAHCSLSLTGDCCTFCPFPTFWPALTILSNQRGPTHRGLVPECWWIESLCHFVQRRRGCTMRCTHGSYWPIVWHDSCGRQLPLLFCGWHDPGFNHPELGAVVNAQRCVPLHFCRRRTFRRRSRPSHRLCCDAVTKPLVRLQIHQL